MGETYFFRELASFEALEREILPPLVARRSEALLAGLYPDQADMPR